MQQWDTLCKLSVIIRVLFFLDMKQNLMEFHKMDFCKTVVFDLEPSEGW